MMRPIVYLLISIVLFISGCADETETQPVDLTPRIGFAPESISIPSGDSAEIQVVVRNLPVGIFGITAWIAFDSSAIDVPEGTVTRGDYFSEGALTIAEGGGSMLRVAVVNTRGSDSGSSEGTLFRLLITGIRATASELEFMSGELRLFDSNGSEVIVDGLEIGFATVTVTN